MYYSKQSDIMAYISKYSVDCSETFSAVFWRQKYRAAAAFKLVCSDLRERRKIAAAIPRALPCLQSEFYCSLGNKTHEEDPH